jgi:hypothetical protein
MVANGSNHKPKSAAPGAADKLDSETQGPAINPGVDREIAPNGTT